MKLRATLLVLAFAVFGISCALVRKGYALTPGGGQAVASCERKYKNRDVSIEEEYALGGTVAVAWANRVPKMRVDIDPAAAPEKPQRIEPKSLKPPKTDVNAKLERLNTIGRNLAGHSSRPMLPWAFGVLEAKEVNAISAPGGFVLVTTGLLDAVPDEATLAGVLAHEIAHITQKHALKAYEHALIEECVASSMGGDLKGVAAGAVSGALPFKANPAQVRAAMSTIADSLSKNLDWDSPEMFDVIGLMTDKMATELKNGLAEEDELKADALAVELIVHAGYNPKPFIDFVAKLPTEGEVGTKHPDSAKRAAAMRAALAKGIGEEPLLVTEQEALKGAVLAETVAKLR